MATPVRPFHSREEKAWEDFIIIFQYLKVSYKEDGGSFFTRSHMERARGNRYN